MNANTNTAIIPRLRLGFCLWFAGMLGVIAITTTALPQLLREVPLPAPLWLISLASLAQSAVFVALAVWAGVRLAPQVGFHAPVFEAAVTGRGIAPALRAQLLPGVLVGVAGGILLVAISRHGPAVFVEAQARLNLSLFARILYGGITEEILLRWGLMTVFAWLAWRLLQHRQGAPRARFVWMAISASALLFGAGHLPAASVLIGALDARIASFVVGANATFGLLFGWLFWRYGLEAAMIAHALAHVVNYYAHDF